MNARIATLLLSVIAFAPRQLASEYLPDQDETAQRGEELAGFVPDLYMGTPTADLFNPCPGHATGLAGEAFSDLLNTLIISECIIGAPCTYPRDVGGECRSSTVFDFIVIGGGTAGAAIASRLSEISDWNILLLEAGGDPTFTSEVPRFHTTLLRSKDLDWSFKTEREEGLFNGYMGRSNRWPRGKCLGGTSTMGHMLYVRNNRRDFDNMAANGLTGWSFTDVYPYFLKSEDMRDFRVISNKITKIFHKRGGPLTLSRFLSNDTMIDVLQRAGLELGYPKNFDVNEVNFAGFMHPNQGLIRTGERLNTAKAFLNPVKQRKNLFIIKYAFVIKVLICPSNMRAYAVEYMYRNEKKSRILRASREIIVSAGVIGTPKILLLSGLGPKNDLEELRIVNLKNLRVGRNLIDHVMFPGAPITINTNEPKKTELEILDAAYEYLTRRTGYYASTGVTSLIGFLNVDNDDIPDIQLEFLYAPQNNPDELNDYIKAMNVDEDIALQYFAMNARADLLLPLPMLMNPKSRGAVKLRSNDSEDLPLLIAGYFDRPEDFSNMMTGLRFIERLANSQALKEYNASLEYITYPGCCRVDPGTEYYWACALSHLAGTGHSQMGTAKMGTPTDPDAVVDNQLRVYGVKGLRVVDASVMPLPLTGSPLSSIVMIAEKAADLIKLCWIPNFEPWSTTKSPYRTPRSTDAYNYTDRYFAHKTG